MSKNFKETIYIIMNENSVSHWETIQLLLNQLEPKTTGFT